MLVLLALAAAPFLYYLFRRVSGCSAWIAGVLVVLPWVLSAALLLFVDVMGQASTVMMDRSATVQLMDPLLAAIVNVTMIGLGTQAYLRDQDLKKKRQITVTL